MNRRQLLRLGVLAPLAPAVLTAVPEAWHVDVFPMNEIIRLVAVMEANAETIQDGCYLFPIHPNSILAKLQRGDAIE